MNYHQQRIAAFWLKVDKALGADGCWLFTGCLNSFGYGSFGYRHYKLPAHRFAYEISVGPIPDGLQIDHLCKNPRCVNPRHLEVVTARENTIRGEGPCAKNHRKTHCIRGHLLAGENVRHNRGGGRSCRVCERETAKRFKEKMNRLRDLLAANANGGR